MEQEETQAEVQHEKKHRKSKKHIVIPAIVLAVVLVVVAGLVWLYTGNISEAKTKVFNAIPLPAAFVDMKVVSASDVIARVNLAKKLLEAQSAGDSANPTETFNQVLESKKVEALASQRNLSTTKELIDEEYKNIITQYAAGDEEGFKTELEKTYEMTPEEFKDQVIRQELLQSQLQVWYNQNEGLNKANYEKIRGFEDRIKKGESFDDVARSYSEDEATKDFAGDSGVIAFTDLLPEFREALANSKVDDVKLVASRYGLHLLKVLELNNDGENGSKQIHLQQIFLKEAGFMDWMTKESDNIRVIKLLKF